MTRYHLGIAWACWIAVAPCSGCNSRPAAVKPPAYDAKGFADAILNRCDANHDQMLTPEEAAQAPGIASKWERYDLDKDGRVSRDELIERAHQWAESGAALVSIRCCVRLGSQELGDVQVKLIPDEALGGAIQTAEAVSQRGRSSPLSIPPDLKPESLRNIPGMQYGLYKVEVSHPTLKLVPTAKSSGLDIGYADQTGTVQIMVSKQ